ncbi:MAG TPA: cyclic nucleotide-binding domain-containing protein [Planctomycetota bacterium]|nr:cyclic nucleotide-binding domain-containing protein [Planctomycetota bacterium]
MHIIAICAEEQSCPLYRRDSRLDFSPPTVHGEDGVPVCSAAVEQLHRAVARITAGQPASAFARTFCGGCPSGKAWWNFEPAPKETESSLSPAAAQFILSSLSKMKLFAGVHPAKLLRIIRLVKGTRVPSGRALLMRGRPGEAFYILLEGECEVLASDDEGRESTLAVLSAGECFGEMSLITGEPVSATVRTKVDSTVLMFSRENFNAMLATAPEIAITIARILAGRLVRTGKQVLEELKKGLVGRLDLISPAELIQAMNVNSQTGMLVVQNGDKSLKIYLHDGQVHEVELGGETGEEAFYEFLTWAKGNFRFEAVRKEQPQKQVRADTVGLLIEGMRRVDEFKQTGVWRKPS